RAFGEPEILGRQCDRVGDRRRGLQRGGGGDRDGGEQDGGGSTTSHTQTVGGCRPGLRLVLKNCHMCAAPSPIRRKRRFPSVSRHERSKDRECGGRRPGETKRWVRGCAHGRAGGSAAREPRR